MSSRMPNRLKELVSKNKIRYQADGFDLDLAYITKNIIAMAFPAENLEGVYRNHMEDVQRFLETKHENHYKIYNLCLEREYLPTKFKGQVLKFPFKDHNPPPLWMMLSFCKDVEEWLSKSEENVAVIHCKAGKGRTGVMICAYLIYSGSMDAEQALNYYAKQRTKDSKGVTIPSQRRYVQYFSQLHPALQHRILDYHPVGLRILAFKFNSIPNFTSGHSCNMYFTIQYDRSLEKFDVTEAARKGDSNIVIEVSHPCQGDVKIDFGCKNILGKESMFQFWFNTFFVRAREVANLNQYHRIVSRRQQESSTNAAASGATNIPVQSNNSSSNNNIDDNDDGAQKQRSTFNSGHGSTSTHSGGANCESDPRFRSESGHAEARTRMKPELKRELISRALMFMQKGHRFHQLPDDLTGTSSQKQVLTYFKVRGSNYGSIEQVGADSTSTSKSLPNTGLSSSCQKKNTDGMVCDEVSGAASTCEYKILALKKFELDKANKDKQHKIFPQDFMLTVYFTSGSVSDHPVTPLTDPSDSSSSEEEEDIDKIYV